MKHLVFVYGTLKNGHIRHGALRDQRYIGVAVTAPEYSMYQLGGYPALVDADKAAKANLPAPARNIWGELYEVDEGCLAELDRIEGVGSNLFERKEIQLHETHVTLLPTSGEVFNKLHRKVAEAYFYCKDVGGARDCGSFWCVKF